MKVTLYTTPAARSASTHGVEALTEAPAAIDACRAYVGARLHAPERSLAVHDGRLVVSPGFQPFAVDEVAMASVAPEVDRRDPPRSVGEVLAWAPFPLATAEIAELRGIGRDDARGALEQAGASFTPSAHHGYWTAA